jgi:hypothetical protein
MMRVLSLVIIAVGVFAFPRMVNCNSHVMVQDVSNSYVCCLAAVPAEREAVAAVEKYRSQGVMSSYLWIPDYSGLSGKPFFLVYAGPYTDAATAKEVLSQLKDQFNNRSFYIKNVGQKVVGNVSSQSANRATAPVPAARTSAPAIASQPVSVPVETQKTKVAEQPTKEFKKSLKLKIGKDNTLSGKKP